MKKYHIFELSLIALTTLFYILHLTLVTKLNQPHLLALHFLAIISLINLFASHHNKYTAHTSIGSSLLGFFCLALVLARSQTSLGYNPHLGIFLGSIGLGCLVLGGKQMYYYRAELIILISLLIQPLFARLLISFNLPNLTTQTSVFMLNILGINAKYNNTLIILPAGRIEVYGSCSGVDMLTLLTFTGILFIVNFPLKKLPRLLCLIGANTIAFLTNSLRVALLAILVANQQNSAFNYWHGNQGGWVFSSTAIAIFASFCWYVLLVPHLPK